MPVATVASAHDILDRLKTQLGGSELTLGPVCTRVMLRTGMNLREPRPDQATDADLLDRVIATLAEMGYRV